MGSTPVPHGLLKKFSCKKRTFFTECIISDFACLACEEKVLSMNSLSSDLQSVHNTVGDLKRKLSGANHSLAMTMEKENKLRNNHESLILEEAQARYELDQLKRQLSDKLQERDEAHAERVRLLENVSICFCFEKTQTNISMLSLLQKALLENNLTLVLCATGKLGSQDPDEEYHLSPRKVKVPSANFCG